LHAAGVWTRDLKVRTNLAQPQVTKMLKALEGKSLIKSVKNVNNPSRKLYMLFELEPSREITGGAWCVVWCTCCCVTYAWSCCAGADCAAFSLVEGFERCGTHALCIYIQCKCVTQMPVSDGVLFLDVQGIGFRQVGTPTSSFVASSLHCNMLLCCAVPLLQVHRPAA
jgi:hypothetical protein